MTGTDPHKARWEDRYAGADYLYGIEANEFLRAATADLPPGRALCVADGEGRNGVYLASLGHEVTSLDLTETGMAKARRLAANQGVGLTTIVGDIDHFDLGTDRWDLIVSIFAHTAPDTRRRFHHRVPDALRDGGVFVLEAYTPDQVGRGTGGPPTPDVAMTLDALTEELAVLNLTHGVETMRDVMEGNGHTGPGAVVQVIAHKTDPTR